MCWIESRELQLRLWLVRRKGWDRWRGLAPALGHGVVGASVVADRIQSFEELGER